MSPAMQLLIEEILDSLAVITVTTSAVYWWKASRVTQDSLDSDPGARARMNARAATHAAIAAALQALAVLTHVVEIAHVLP